ncbi:MAG TPA: HAD family phosphatase [Anaerolineales bacterium]|nr:HAD family phosphatase [Anaerolineales bacterium]
MHSRVRTILPGEIGVVFDFGNVLLDWNPYYLYGKFFHGDLEKTQQFLDEIGFKEWNIQQDAGRPFSQAVSQLCAEFPQYCELIRAYDDRWEESLGGAIQPVVDVLAQLHQAGHELYALSNWSAEKFYLVRPKFAFMDYFKDIVISGEEKLVKPDARIFEVLIQRTGRPAHELLLIDDSEANVDTACSLGMQAIHLIKPESLGWELEKVGIANWR